MTEVVNYGKPPRGLSRCTDAELIRRQYELHGSYPWEKGQRIKESLLATDHIVVVKRLGKCRQWMRLWYKKRIKVSA